jgi:dihydroxyacetone kinase-like predicted kinase
LTREGICVATKSAADAAIALLDALIDDDSELVTVVIGAEAEPADTTRISEHLGLVHPDVELELQTGGQPLYPYLVGVE